MSNLSKLLQDPFSADDLEWRVQRCGKSANNKPYTMVVAYVTNRAIQQRLDDVVGLGKWCNEYKPSPDGKGFLCGISVKLDDEWVTKWDGAECTQIEPLKGGLSGAMKRAAVQLGIGRYLYNLETEFAKCSLVDARWQCKGNHATFKDGGVVCHIDWQTPDLPDWALPGVDVDEYSELIAKAESLEDLKNCFAEAYLYAKSFGRTDLSDRFKKEYDAMKALLDIEAQKNIASAYKHTSEWLNQQLKSLSLIEEESSVKRVCNTYREHLKKKIEGQYYESSGLFDAIDKKEKQRIETINNQQEGNNS